VNFKFAGGGGGDDGIGTREASTWSASAAVKNLIERLMLPRRVT